MNPKIEKLIKLFAKLPRVGSRGGQRIALCLLQDKTGRAAALASAIMDASENIAPCPTCGVLTDRGAGGCEFCRDASRANGQLCIVRDLSDVWTLEKSSVFHGRYHIIGGLLSGASGILPQDLNIATLPARIADEKITEIILHCPILSKARRPSIISCRLSARLTVCHFLNWHLVCHWVAILIIWMMAR